MYEDTLASIQEDFPHIHGFQIHHENRLVFEAYQNGIDRETAGPVVCIFKSFVSAAIGIAIGDGLIASVYQNILGFFPDVNPADARMHEITIAHALTKTTGIAWPPPASAASMPPSP